MVEVIENAKPEDWQEGDIVDILNVNFSKKHYVESYFRKILRGMLDYNGATIRITRQSEPDKIRAEIERLQARLVEIEPETENATPPQHVFDAAEGFGQYFKSQLPPPPEGFGEWILHEGNCYPLDGPARDFDGAVMFITGFINTNGGFWYWDNKQVHDNARIIAYALPLKQNGGGA